MHDVTYIQVVDPVILLADTQVVSYRDFELFVLLDCFNVFDGPEAYIQLVPLGHKVFYTITLKKLNISLFGANFTAG